MEELPGRGAIALRGLKWGAILGGALGYLLLRDEEFGAVAGPIVGAIYGAPVGMVVLLLVTPL